jgi:hypothetical protein
MKTLITAMMVCTLSADVDSVNITSPEYVIENHPTYVADADVKKKKKKGKKLSQKGKKKKKGFFSKVFGSK